MFRFWNSDSRPTKETSVATYPSTIQSETHTETITDGATPARKRLREDDDDDDQPSPVRRARHENIGPSGLVPTSERCAPRSWKNRNDVQVFRDHVEHFLSQQILTKHTEKRLIDQELAKCQVALEQLRRCHLVPFPVNYATPDQRVEISNGNGAALQNNSNELVPRWAPPFGVTDGPYARHYAQWLLPHSSFGDSDGEWQYATAAVSEGRTTRNSAGDPLGPPRGRSARGSGIGSTAQAFPGRAAEPKKKSGPCVLKRSDGQMVKLVCLTCKREDFSSTQGFINHCRIAHKDDYKSHDEAATKCGQPIDTLDGICNAAEERPPPQLPQPMAVHPFARADMTEQEAYAALRSRIADSMEILCRSQLSGVSATPRRSPQSSLATASETTEAPSGALHLSRLLQARNFKGNLAEMLKEARTSPSLDESTFGEESEEESPVSDQPLARLPVVKRVPARTTQPLASSSRPVSGKGFDGAAEVPQDVNQIVTRTPDENVDIEEPSLSPNTLVSNNAPSLVSDDGEYDSDEGTSVSGQSDDSLEAESVSDVAEINLEDEHDSRVLRRTSTGVPGTVRLRRDDPKHVSFVGPMANGRSERPRRHMV